MRTTQAKTWPFLLLTLAETLTLGSSSPFFPFPLVLFMLATIDTDDTALPGLLRKVQFDGVVATKKTQGTWDKPVLVATQDNNNEMRVGSFGYANKTKKEISESCSSPAFASRNLQSKAWRDEQSHILFYGGSPGCLDYRVQPFAILGVVE